jgi:glycosyltransferase involved in cell wall biosynthesis
MKLSVVICTHNPRDDYLGRTLDALRQQRLPKSEWELVVIDNASNPPLAGRLDLSWHPDFRLILEPEPGVIMARICGIREARHKVIVFVDDDNALAPDYLENSLSIAHNFPMIGAWGGQQIPEFEAEPSPALADFLPFLALRQFSKAQWSNYDTPWRRVLSGPVWVFVRKWPGSSAKRPIPVPFSYGSVVVKRV